MKAKCEAITATASVFDLFTEQFPIGPPIDCPMKTNQLPVAPLRIRKCANKNLSSGNDSIGVFTDTSEVRIFAG
jgi:hypothetical protein